MARSRAAGRGTRGHGSLLLCSPRRGDGLPSSAPPGRTGCAVTVPRVPFAFGELHPWLQPPAPLGPNIGGFLQSNLDPFNLKPMTRKRTIIPLPPKTSLLPPSSLLIPSVSVFERGQKVLHHPDFRTDRRPRGERNASAIGMNAQAVRQQSFHRKTKVLCFAASRGNTPQLKPALTGGAKRLSVKIARFLDVS